LHPSSAQMLEPRLNAQNAHGLLYCLVFDPFI
jgi:hypothetical protein